MSTYEVDDKAISGFETEVTHDTAEEYIPATKSSVHGRPDPLLQTARYKKQDIVHFAGLVGGRRIKVTGEVFQSRYNKERQYVEHQLKDVLTGTLSQNGTWFRDGDLKLERAAQR